MQGGQSTSHHSAAQDVQFLGLQIIQDSVQTIRQSVFYNNRRQGSQRADCA